VKTKWYGHACSRIEGDGISIVIAPYIPEEAGPVPVEELSISALLRTTDPAN
jgi:L-ascorbate metabolism protein UlaG (beta-lactamase superfamily)